MQWLDFFNENDIDQKLTLFNSNVIELMNRHAPLITKNVKNFNAPWMTAEIRSLLSERDKLRDRSKRTKIPIDLENFRKARNKVKQVIRNSKIKYYYDTFARCNDSKTMWSTIKSLRIGKPPTQKVDPVMPVNDLNSHYASVSSVRNSELIDSATSQYSNLPRKFSDINEQFFFGYAMPLDIYKAIQSIKSKATAMPHFDYASVLFTDMPAYNNLRLQRAQNACVRFITAASRYEHITPYYRAIDFKKIVERREIDTAVLVSKIIKFKSPSYLRNSYQFACLNKSSGTRSSKSRLQIPTHRTQKYHLSFLVRSSQLWNELALYHHLHLSPQTIRRKLLNA
ncbi:polyprotein [Frankliniella fusca]|uniref:Polyprotein n=1 Tax=Frankliniella fusca TaxID=407009 RepID=A0AAE1HC53_9NEOP|nr:polyprotein [Frankliniella fusca]